jgi:CHAT domain-containing protein
MRLTFSVSGAELRCVEDRTPLARRHLLPYDPPRVAELSAELLAVLERANRARTLSEANLANLKLAGEELARQLIPQALQSRLRDSMGSLALAMDEELAPVPWELLYDGEQFLCRRFDLGRRLITDWPPAATVWRPAELGQPLRMLVICSDTRGDLDRLEEECASLLATMDAHPDKLSVRLLRAQDLESVRRALKSYDLVHFAGHADYDPRDPGARVGTWGTASSRPTRSPPSAWRAPCPCWSSPTPARPGSSAPGMPSGAGGCSAWRGPS